MLFLDFDGVLCDSIDECYVSSWIAYAAAARDANAIAIADHARFARYRPFIRRGADYMLLQECIDRGIELASQRDFDAELARAGEGRMEEYDRSFYEARRRLLDSERSWWLALNRPYPGIVRALAGVASNRFVHIISTKRADYIAEIVRAWGVEWPLERIFHSGTRSKEEYIRTCLDREEAGAALLVDDQIDHLQRLGDERVSGRLAVWGYVKPEWLRDQSVERIELPEFVELLERSREAPA